MRAAWLGRRPGLEECRPAGKVFLRNLTTPKGHFWGQGSRAGSSGGAGRLGQEYSEGGGLGKVFFRNEATPLGRWDTKSRQLWWTGRLG